MRLFALVLALTIALCTPIRAQEPDPTELKTTAVEHIAAKQYDKAITLLNEAIQRSPKYTAAYFERARAHFSLKRLPEALRDFGQVAELRPQQPIGWYNKGVVEMAFAPPRYSDAIASFTRAIQVGESKPVREGETDLVANALVNRAICYEKTGKKTLAKKDRDAAAAREKPRAQP